VMRSLNYVNQLRYSSRFMADYRIPQNVFHSAALWQIWISKCLITKLMIINVYIYYEFKTVYVISINWNLPFNQTEYNVIKYIMTFTLYVLGSSFNLHI
jgi:prepilin signal peptidase PulO-like enzyme (type II secretory pathway)